MIKEIGIQYLAILFQTSIIVLTIGLIFFILLKVKIIYKKQEGKRKGYLRLLKKIIFLSILIILLGIIFGQIKRKSNLLLDNTKFENKFIDSNIVITIPKKYEIIGNKEALIQYRKKINESHSLISIMWKQKDDSTDIVNFSYKIKGQVFKESKESFDFSFYTDSLINNSCDNIIIERYEARIKNKSKIQSVGTLILIETNNCRYIVIMEYPNNELTEYILDKSILINSITCKN